MNVKSLLLTIFLAPVLWANNPLTNPDLFAWQIFIELNHPATLEKPGFPDPQKKIGDAGKTVWETWILASEVYANPHQPPLWPSSSYGGKKYEDLEGDVLQQLLVNKLLQNKKQRFSVQLSDDEVWEMEEETEVSSPDSGSEVRMNYATWQHIVSNEFYNIEGQETFFQSNKKIDFPIESKEIKARWRKLNVNETQLYHSTLVQKPDGKVEEWGLVALHITTKDIPNWFWATFEHKNNLGIDSVVPTLDTHGVPEVLKNTKWENYVLRGTQVSFTDSIGRPIVLANSVIERGFQATSSCMTCHSRATIGPRPRKLIRHQQNFFVQDNHDATRLSIFESIDPLKGSIGVPRPKWFINTNTWPPTKQFIQTDFVWSFMRAKRKYPFWTETNLDKDIDDESNAK